MLVVNKTRKDRAAQITAEPVAAAGQEELAGIKGDRQIGAGNDQLPPGWSNRIFVSYSCLKLLHLAGLFVRNEPGALKTALHKALLIGGYGEATSAVGMVHLIDSGQEKSCAPIYSWLMVSGSSSRLAVITVG